MKHIDVIPLTDTHVHFWDLRLPSLRYDWLRPDAEDDRNGDIGAIKSVRYFPEDYVAESRFHSVGKVVHMQAAIGSDDPVEETRWLQALADKGGIPQGIVAYVDLASANAAEVLKGHAEFPNLRGVRDLRSDDYFENVAWRRGYALLESLNLICCDAPRVELMSKAARFVEKHPGVIYCVDHAGYPSRRDRTYFKMWRDQMRKLARVKNTVVKISGLGTSDRRWTLDSLRPWMLECIDAWGSGRVVLGTNWPVDRLFSSFGDLVEAYRAVIGELSNSEQFAILSGNADRIFRLNEDVTSGMGSVQGERRHPSPSIPAPSG